MVYFLIAIISALFGYWLKCYIEGEAELKKMNEENDAYDRKREIKKIILLETHIKFNRAFDRIAALEANAKKRWCENLQRLVPIDK